MRNAFKRVTGAGLLIVLLFLTACQNKIAPSVIAISKASDNYINWLKRADSTVQYINLYPLSLDSAMKVLPECDGLLLTGGEDVYPGIYAEAGDTSRCGPINFFRDTLEINLLLGALDLEMPIFGVCRGEQLLNVVFGGELFIDIPQDYDTTVLHQCEDYRNCYHMVYVEQNTFLHKLCDCDSALVTTNHHQAVRVIAPDLKANAYGADGLIEGVELADGSGQPFLLAVQWHPERMEPENPLSGPLVEAFLIQCRIYSLRW